MTSVTVIDPGLQTTLQDAGRIGWEHLGVPRGGAMDFAAFRWANRLAGNGSDFAVLESVLQGLAISADDDVWVGITGAGRVEVDGRLYPTWSGFLLPAGSVLRISRLQGARCYVALHGGIDVSPVLGSRSTYLPARLGGLDGRPLRVSDRLPIGRGARRRPALGKLLLAPPPLRQSPLRIRIMPGPWHGEMATGSLSVLMSAAYSVSSQSNEMGLRLQGPAMPPGDGAMRSQPMPAGAVQVTPSGQPIVLLNARGTIGGYPVLGVVATPDIWRLGQARPADRLTFEHISVEGAREATAEELAALNAAWPTAARVGEWQDGGP